MSKSISVHNMFSPSSELGISTYSKDSMTSYCGLVDAKIRASDKDLPVTLPRLFQTCSVDVFLLFSPQNLIGRAGSEPTL